MNEVCARQDSNSVGTPESYRAQTSFIQKLGLFTNSRGDVLAFVFAQELAKTWILANRGQVAILAQIAEVAIAELHCLAQGSQRQIDLVEEGVAASEVVVS